MKVPIYKEFHKNVIGKGGANIRKIREETSTRIDLPPEGSESDMIMITGRKEDVDKARDRILKIQSELVKQNIKYNFRNCILKLNFAHFRLVLFLKMSKFLQDTTNLSLVQVEN